VSARSNFCTADTTVMPPRLYFFTADTTRCMDIETNDHRL
jgi:hypothetical protein